MEIEFERPYKKMYDFVFSNKRFSLCIGSSQTGKTTGCLTWLFMLALAGEKNKNYLWAAPYYSQAKLAFVKGQNLLQNVPNIDFNQTNLTIRFPNKSTIHFKSVENPNSIYGNTFHGVVIDEATRTREEAWSAINTRIVKTKAPLRAISNATTSSNWFYRKWLHYSNSPDPDVDTHKITAYDAIEAGILDREEIERQKRDLPKEIFEMEYLGIPSAGGDNPFGEEHIKACLKPFSTQKTLIWGVDLAKSVDWTVMIGLDYQGNTTKIERFNGTDWPNIIEKIKNTIGKCPAIMDNTGVGSPVVDSLLSHGYKIHPFQFTASSKPDLINNLIVSVQNHSLSFPEDSIVHNELLSYAWEIKNGRLSYTTYSTDDAVMALALANWGLKYKIGNFLDPGVVDVQKETSIPTPEKLEELKEERIRQWMNEDEDDEIVTVKFK